MNRMYPMVFILQIVTVSGCTLKYGDPETSINQTPVHTFRIPGPSTVYIDIRGSFTPSELNIATRTTVKWRNYDSAKHAIFVDNVTSLPFEDRGSWSYTFNKTGSFKYNCSVHPWTKEGLIVVK